jgi:hypothetical protein
MSTEDADELVAYPHVRVLKSSAGALYCLIGDKRIWLPREHIKGRLWSRGDVGTLLVRRWIALDRHLAEPDEAPAVRLACQPLACDPPSGRLHGLPSRREPYAH